MTGIKIARAFAIVASIAVVAHTIGACRPMYGSTSLGNSLKTEMAAIEIATIPGRVGQKIRNELIFLFTGGDHPEIPKYQLNIVIRKSTQGVLYKKTDDASGMIVSIDADYTLKDASGKKELMKGRSHARAAYDKHTSTFSNVRGERDALNRAAKDIARDINTQVAAHISSYQ
jgi:LPS-assembly lipoprotein